MSDPRAALPAQARGRDFLDAAAFVRETYGAEAHDRVLAALDPHHRALFQQSIRDVDWYPLDALVVYLRAAQAILDPDSADFFRRQGFFAAQRQRAVLLANAMATPESRARLAPTTWRMFYSVGRLEVVGDSPGDARGRIHDFPATAELCERFCGIWEGMVSTPERRVRAEETRCVRRGDPYCEIRIAPTPAAEPSRPGDREPG
ncbi:MAG: hypothetical protein ACM3OB_01605 [Acidobacteriota bacterium]